MHRTAVKSPRDGLFWRQLGAACALLFAVTALPAGDEARREIVNAGVSGNNTADLLVRLEQDVLRQRPGVVVLLVGTNDVLNSRNARSLDEYREGLQAITARIARSGSRLLLVTIPPAHGPYLIRRHSSAFYGPGGPSQLILAANGVIRRVAAENGLPVVDFFAACEQAGGATGAPDSLIRNLANSGAEDGVHPTAEGYRLLGRLVAAALAREGLGSDRRIVCLGDSITWGVHMRGEGTATGETYPAFLARALEETHP